MKKITVLFFALIATAGAFAQTGRQALKNVDEQHRNIHHERFEKHQKAGSFIQGHSKKAKHFSKHARAHRKFIHRRAKHHRVRHHR